METEFLTRRDFLKLSGLGLEYLFLKPFLTNETLPESPENVVQTGIEEIRIKGNDYRISINQESIVNLSLLMAREMGGERLFDKTNNWFSNNHLEIELSEEYLLKSELFNLPALKGLIVPAELNPEGNQTKIVISELPIKELFYYKRNPERSKPATTFPHEFFHLAEYIDSPQQYVQEILEVKTKVDKILSVSLFTGILAGLKVKEPKVLKLMAGGVVYSATALAGILLDPSLVDHQEKYERRLTNLLNTDEEIRQLTLNTISFTPVE